MNIKRFAVKTQGGTIYYIEATIWEIQDGCLVFMKYSPGTPSEWVAAFGDKQWMQVFEVPSLTCSKRIQKGEFLKPCGQPADAQSCQGEPRCHEHLPMPL